MGATLRSRGPLCGFVSYGLLDGNRMGGGMWTYIRTDTVGLVGAGFNGVIALGDSVVVLGTANHCEGVVSDWRR